MPPARAIPNVVVTAVNGATGLTRSATTSNSGAYTLTELPIGTYKLTISSQGFKTIVRSAIVSTGAETRLRLCFAGGPSQRDHYSRRFRRR